MFSLNEIFQNAQGGQAANNLADQFGLSSEQVEGAVKALLPALSMAFLSKLQNPGQLGGLISSLSDGQHTSTFQNADAAQSPEATAKGNDILSQLFGDSHVVTQIAQQAANVTGLRADVIVSMLPVVVSMLAGGLSASLQNQGLGGLFGQILGGAGAAGANGAAEASSGGLLGLVGKLLGGLFGGQSGQPGGSPVQSGLDSLSKILQPGTAAPAGLEDEIGRILSGSSSR